MRLDRLQEALWPKAISGDTRAADVVLRIMNRRARMLGIDAPARIDITAWIREIAVKEGMDPEQAVRDAKAILRATGL